MPSKYNTMILFHWWVDAYVVALHTGTLYVNTPVSGVIFTIGTCVQAAHPELWPESRPKHWAGIHCACKFTVGFCSVHGFLECLLLFLMRRKSVKCAENRVFLSVLLATQLHHAFIWETLWPRRCSQPPLRIQSRSSPEAFTALTRNHILGLIMSHLMPFVHFLYSEYDLSWEWGQIDKCFFFT